MIFLDSDDLRAMERHFELESDRAFDDTIYTREEIQALRKYVVGFIFEGDGSEILIYQNDMMKMEFQILDVLDRRLSAVNAICFVQYFLNAASIPSLNMDINLTRIIIQSQADIQFTGFKPSVIAASAILAANHFLYPNEHDTVKRKLSAGPHVRLEEEKLTSCLNSLIDMCVSRGIIVKKEEAQRMDVEGPSSGRRVGGETEIRGADEETPYRHAPGKDIVGSTEIQESPVADEEGLMWNICDYVEADYLNALAAFDSDPETEEAGFVKRKILWTFLIL